MTPEQIHHPECLSLCTKKKHCHAKLIDDQVFFNNVNKDHHGHYKLLHHFNSEEKSEEFYIPFLLAMIPPTLHLVYFSWETFSITVPKSHLFLVPCIHCLAPPCCTRNTVQGETSPLLLQKVSRSLAEDSNPELARTSRLPEN